MICIMCLADRPESDFNDEHVFPESIGGNFIVRTVCTNCNSVLGTTVDVDLTDHFLVQGERMLLNIPGKSGHVPNPLERGTLVDDPTHKIISVLSADGKPIELHTVTGVNRKKNTDGSETISIHVDRSEEDNLPQIVNKIRVRAGLPPLSIDEIRSLQVQQTLPNPWANIQAKIDLIRYHRAIVKIAYELAYHWLGPAYLGDPFSTRLRQLLFDKGNPNDWSNKYKVPGNIAFIDGNSQYPFWMDRTKSHIGMLMSTGGRICAYVRIFELMEGIVQISASAHLYPTFSGMFISTNPKTGDRRESSLSDEIARIGTLRN